MLFMRQLQIDSTSIPRRMTVERPSKGRRTAVERQSNGRRIVVVTSALLGMSVGAVDSLIFGDDSTKIRQLPDLACTSRLDST